jgi:sulfur-carrier protein
MKIEIRLYASLSALLPNNESGQSFCMDIEDGTTIQKLLDKIKVPREMPRIIFRNGIHANGPDVLEPGDRLAVFPPVAGG